MCTSGGKVKTPPPPIPPPEYAEYAKRRKQLQRPASGSMETIFTSPLGLTNPVNTIKEPTLLGQ